MLTIYMENPEIPVGKSNGTHHSIWTRKTYERLKIKKVKHYFEKEIPSHFLKKQKKKKKDKRERTMSRSFEERIFEVIYQTRESVFHQISKH